MGKRIEGITIGISGDTSSLNAALAETEKNIGRLSGELREVDKALKFNPGNMELLGQKSEILKKEIASLADKFKTLKDAEQKAQKAHADGKMDGETYRAFQREIVKTEDRLKEMKGRLEETGEALKNAGKSAISFGDILKANILSDAIYKGFDMLVNGVHSAVNALSNFVQEGAANAALLAENQAKLQQVMQNTMDAAAGEAASIVALADSYELLGVVSTETQIAGAQELATYVSKKQSLEAMIPVLNDMVAQQYGYNASAEAAVTISTALGKIVNGDTGALKRYGYSFTEAQEAMIKFGTEEEAVATLADVVRESVGGVNEALGQTDIGKQIRLNAELGQTQDRLGEIYSSIKTEIAAEMLPVMQELSQEVLNFVENNKEGFKDFAIELKNGLVFLIENGDTVMKVLTAIGVAVGGWKIAGVIANVSNALHGMTAASQGAATALTMVQAAINPVGIAIVGVTAAIGLSIFAWNKHKEAQEAARQEMLQTGETLRQVSADTAATMERLDTTQNLVRQWEELNKTIQTGALNTDELGEAKKRLAAIEQALIDNSDGFITQYTIENGNLEENIYLLNEKLEAEKANAKLQLEQQIRDVNIDELIKQKDELNERERELTATVEEQKAAYVAMAQVEQDYIELCNRQRETSEDLGDEFDIIAERARTAGAAFGRDYTGNLTMLIGSTKTCNDSLKESENQLIKTREEWSLAVDSEIEYNKALAEYEALNVPKMIGDQTDALERQNQKLTENERRLKASVEANVAQTEKSNELVASINETDKALNNLDKAYDTVKKGGELTTVQIQELIDDFPQLSQYINENGIASLKNGDILKTVSGATRKERKKNIDAAIAEQETTITAMKEQARQAATSYTEIVKSISTVAEARSILARTEVFGPQMPDYVKVNKDIEESEKTLAKLKALSASISGGGGGGGGSGGGGGAAKAAAKTIKEANIDIAESTKEAAEEAQKAYEQLAKIGTEESKKLAQTAKTAADEAFNAAEVSATTTGDAVQEATKASQKASTAAKDVAKDTAKYVEEYNKQQKESFEKYGNAITEGLKEKYALEYEAKEKALKDNLDLVKTAEYNEIELIKENSDDKITILTDEYIEKIRLIDEATAASLDGINKEIDAELEKLGITNAELAEKIQASRDRIAEIEAESEADRKAIEERRQAERIAALEKKIEEAETVEAQMEAQKALDDYLADIEQKHREDARKEEAKKLKEDIRNAEDKQKEEIKLAKKTIEEKKKAQEELLIGKDGLATGIEKGEFGEGKTLSDNLKDLKKEYNAMVKDAPKLAADLVKSGEAGQKAALEILKKYYPNWKEAGNNFVDYYNDGIDEKSDELQENMLVVGTQTMQGFLDGLIGKEDEIIAEAQRIANLVQETIRSALDIHSPSRVMVALGGYTGQGFATGIENAIPLVRQASAKLGLAGVPNTKNNAQGAASGAGQSTSTTTNSSIIHLKIENFNNNRSQDIQNLAEELNFFSNQQSKGRGE